MALAGRFICLMTGIDSMGEFDPSLDGIVVGLGYASPPIMALLFILDDEVVKVSPHAHAIRDVEDEELWSLFYGISPWQSVLIVAASSVGKELFYRAAVQVLSLHLYSIASWNHTSQPLTQAAMFPKLGPFTKYLSADTLQGALAEIFLKGTDLVTNVRGIASLTGLLPPYVPFAQAFAAVITAGITGSLYYVAASPKDPTYVVAPVLQTRSGRKDLKKLFAAWYERLQMKKIYSPLLEGLLALHLGFEWIQTNNIFAPIITHGIYSSVILGHRLSKIHDHRRKFRQRIQQLKEEGKDSGQF